VLDGKGPAEAAAFMFMGQLHQFDIVQLADQVFGMPDHLHFPQGVAGGMPGDSQRRPPVFQAHAEHLHHELGPLEHARGKGLGLREVLFAGEELGIVVLHHPGAGT